MARLSIVLTFSAFGLLAEELPLVTKVEFQPFSAQVTRIMQSLDLLGEPLPAAEAAEIKRIIEAGSGGAAQIEQLQKLLDKHCLAGVEINPESRVKVQQGQAKAELMEQGWRAFLIKVHNEAGVTAVLAVDSPNIGQLANSSAKRGRAQVDGPGDVSTSSP
jgi:hypothetical protein